MPEQEKEKEEKKPKGKMIKIIMVLVLVAALGGGGFLAWNFLEIKKQSSTEIEEKKPQKVVAQKPISYSLDSFIVNLMDKTGLGKRYLKVGIILEIDTEERKILIEKYKPKIRDTILLLLSSKTFGEISTMEGKLELKRGLITRLNQILGETIINKIYFTEFVVQ